LRLRRRARPIAWRTYAELQKLQATAATATSERAELQSGFGRRAACARKWTRGRRRRTPRRAMKPTTRVRYRRQQCRSCRRCGGEGWPAFSHTCKSRVPNNPETQRALTAKITAQVESRYADLFLKPQRLTRNAWRIQTALVERICAVDVGLR